MDPVRRSLLLRSLDRALLFHPLALAIGDLHRFAERTLGPTVFCVSNPHS